MIATFDKPSLPGKAAAFVILVPRIRFHQERMSRNERVLHWGDVLFRMLKQSSAGGQTVFFLSLLQEGGSGNNDDSRDDGRYGGEDEERAAWEGNSEITNV